MGAIVSLHGRELGFDVDTGEIIRRGVRGMGGLPNGSTVVARHYGTPAMYRTELTLTATPISISDDAGVAQYGGVKVFDFPEGLIFTYGAMVTGNLTGYASLIDTFDGDVALGSATAGTGATLTGTEADIMQSNAITQAVGEVAAVAGVSVATALTESPGRVFNGTATALDMFLNFVIDDNAAHAAGTASFTGTIKFLWSYLGDD